jgi:hypothetical protein
VNHPQLLATALLTTGELLEQNITAIIKSYSHSLVLPSPPAAAKELYHTREYRNHAAKCHSHNISTRHDRSTKHHSLTSAQAPLLCPENHANAALKNTACFL